MEFQRLTGEMVPSACELSTQAGWEQTPEDWLRLLRLNPEGVWVWLDDGAVRASFSLTAFGREVTWIGMVLVDKACGGRGLGTAAFTAAVEKAEALRTDCLGLDATESGELIYRKFGFEPAGPITRWRGKWSGRATQSLTVGFDETIALLDRQITGVNRRALLEDLAASGALFLSLRAEGRAAGYAVAKRSRTAFQIGPVLALSASVFEELMGGCALRSPHRPLLCDALHPEATFVLRANGLKPERTLKRMTMPFSPHCLRREGIWCGAGFELG